MFRRLAGKLGLRGKEVDAVILIGYRFTGVSRNPVTIRAGRDQLLKELSYTFRKIPAIQENQANVVVGEPALPFSSCNGFVAGNVLPLRMIVLGQTDVIHKLNSYLPPTIKVFDLIQVSPEFKVADWDRATCSCFVPTCVLEPKVQSYEGYRLPGKILSKLEDTAKYMTSIKDFQMFDQEEGFGGSVAAVNDMSIPTLFERGGCEYLKLVIDFSGLDIQNVEKIVGTTLAAMRSDLEVEELLNFTPTSEVKLPLFPWLILEKVDYDKYNNTVIQGVDYREISWLSSRADRETFKQEMFLPNMVEDDMTNKMWWNEYLILPGQAEKIQNGIKTDETVEADTDDTTQTIDGEIILETETITRNDNAEMVKTTWIQENSSAVITEKDDFTIEDEQDCRQITNDDVMLDAEKITKSDNVEVMKTNETLMAEQDNFTHDTLVTEKDDLTHDTMVTEKDDLTHDTMVTEKDDLTHDTAMTEKDDLTHYTPMTEKDDLTHDTAMTEKDDLTHYTPMTEKDDLTHDNPMTEKDDLTHDTPMTEKDDLTHYTPITEKDYLRYENQRTEKDDLTHNTPMTEKDDLTHDTPMTEKDDLTHDTPMTEKDDLTHYTPITEKDYLRYENQVTEKEDLTHNTPMTEKDDLTHDNPMTEKDDLTHYTPITEKDYLRYDNPMTEKDDLTPETVMAKKDDLTRTHNTMMAEKDYLTLSGDTMFAEKDDLTRDKMVAEKTDLTYTHDTMMAEKDDRTHGTLMGEKDDLSHSIDTMMAEKDVLTPKKDDLDHSSIFMKAKRDDLDRRSKFAKTKNRDLDLSSKTTTAEKADVDHNIKTAKAKKEDLDHTIKTTKAKKGDLDHTIKTAKAKMEDIDHTSKTAKAKMEDIDHTSKTAKAKKEDINHTNENVKAEKKDLDHTSKPARVSNARQSDIGEIVKIININSNLTSKNLKDNKDEQYHKSNSGTPEVVVEYLKIDERNQEKTPVRIKKNSDSQKRDTFETKATVRRKEYKGGMTGKENIQQKDDTELVHTVDMVNKQIPFQDSTEFIQNEFLIFLSDTLDGMDDFLSTVQTIIPNVEQMHSLFRKDIKRITSKYLFLMKIFWKYDQILNQFELICKELNVICEEMETLFNKKFLAEAGTVFLQRETQRKWKELDEKYWFTRKKLARSLEQTTKLQSIQDEILDTIISPNRFIGAVSKIRNTQGIANRECDVITESQKDSEHLSDNVVLDTIKTPIEVNRKNKFTKQLEHMKVPENKSVAEKQLSPIVGNKTNRNGSHVHTETQNNERKRILPKLEDLW